MAYKHEGHPGNYDRVVWDRHFDAFVENAAAALVAGQLDRDTFLALHRHIEGSFQSQLALYYWRQFISSIQED